MGMVTEDMRTFHVFVHSFIPFCFVTPLIIVPNSFV